MKHDKFDLERELREGRSEPRADFASALAGEVRGAVGRARQGRMGLMVALAGLVVVAVASFGGVGYASSQKPVAKTAAAAEYKQFTKKASTHQEQVAGQAKAIKAAPKVKSGQLPFTGLALWIPLAGGGVLIALGLTLRIRGRRGGPLAH
jgi:hypothetical protein